MKSHQLLELQDKLCRFLRCGPDSCWVVELEDGAICVGTLVRSEFGYVDHNASGGDFEHAYSALRTKLRS